MSLYDKIGGKPALEKVVTELHKRILADGSLKPFFASTDMAKQHNLQVAFFSQILEGPKEYGGRAMEKTHTGMNLQQPHFDAILKHLGESMTAAGVSADDTKAALANVSALKGAILGK
ncbi:group I truncated hemoglobin [Fortiea contorta]|uniref:group I truncated hemoglobin n=1 Tax=Fortiea contorta TaxID=1892405 RepID=UPI00034CF06A|nr:group 1 truncated hemoglobin [Fortiea contorta]